MIPVLPLPPHWLPCQYFGVLTAWDSYRAGYQGISFRSFARLWKDAGLEGLFDEAHVKAAFLAAPQDEGRRLNFHSFYGMLEKLSEVEQAMAPMRVDVLKAVADLGPSLPHPQSGQTLQEMTPACMPGSSQLPSLCSAHARPQSACPRGAAMSDTGATPSQVLQHSSAAHPSQQQGMLGSRDTMGASCGSGQLLLVRPSTASPASRAAWSLKGGSRPASPTPLPRPNQQQHQQQQQQPGQSSWRSSKHVPQPPPVARVDIGEGRGSASHLQAEAVPARIGSKQESLAAGAGRQGLALPEEVAGCRGAHARGSVHEAGKQADTPVQGTPMAHSALKPNLRQVEELRDQVAVLQAAVAQLQGAAQQSGPSHGVLLQGSQQLGSGDTQQQQQQQQQEHERQPQLLHQEHERQQRQQQQQQQQQEQQLQQWQQQQQQQREQQQQQQQLVLLQQQVHEQARELGLARRQLQRLEQGMARQAEQHTPPSQCEPEATVAGSLGQRSVSKAPGQLADGVVQQHPAAQLRGLQQQVERLAEVQVATEQELHSVRQQAAGSLGWQAGMEQLREQLEAVQQQRLADQAAMQATIEQVQQQVSTLRQKQRQAQLQEESAKQAEKHEQRVDAQIQALVDQRLTSIRQQHEGIKHNHEQKLEAVSAELKGVVQQQLEQQRKLVAMEAALKGTVQQQLEQQQKLEAVAAEQQEIVQHQLEHAAGRQAVKQRVEQLSQELERAVRALDDHQQQQQPQQQQLGADAASQASFTAEAGDAAGERSVELPQAQAPPVVAGPLFPTPSKESTASLDVWNQVQELDAHVLELAGRLSQQESWAQLQGHQPPMQNSPTTEGKLDVQTAMQELNAAVSVHIQQLSTEAAKHEERLSHTAAAVQRVLDGHSALDGPVRSGHKGALDGKSDTSDVRRLVLILTAMEEHLHATDARLDNLVTQHRAMQGTVDNLRVSTLESVLSLMERPRSQHDEGPPALQADVNELRDWLSRLDLQVTSGLSREPSSQSLHSYPPDTRRHTEVPLPSRPPSRAGSSASADRAAPLGDPPTKPPPPHVDPLLAARRMNVGSSPSRFRPPIKQASMSKLAHPSPLSSRLKRSSHEPIPSPLSPESSSLRLNLLQQHVSKAEEGGEPERGINRSRSAAPRTGSTQALRSCLARPIGSMTTVHRMAIPPTVEALRAEEGPEQPWFDERVRFSADTRDPPPRSFLRRATGSEDGAGSSRSHRVHQPPPAEEGSLRSVSEQEDQGLHSRPESVFRQRWSHAGDKDRSSNQSTSSRASYYQSPWIAASQRLNRAQSREDSEAA